MPAVALADRNLLFGDASRRGGIGVRVHVVNRAGVSMLWLQGQKYIRKVDL